MSESQSHENSIMLGQIAGLVEEYIPNPSECTTLEAVELLKLQYEAALAENIMLKKKLKIWSMKNEEEEF